MTVNPMVPGKGSTPQVSSAQGQAGDEAFNEFTKSDGSTKEALDHATSERTKITRAQRIGRSSKKHSLKLLDFDNEDITSEPEFRTVMVDGKMYTLRLVAVA